VIAVWKSTARLINGLVDLREPAESTIRVGSLKPKLSFCIPTRNRGGFIAACVESITRQATEAVEVVVVDGASTDDTASVMRGLQMRYSNIRYHYKAKNGGVDADLAEAVALASGEYCWLMSSDDALADGAVERMLREIESMCAVYLCSRIDCDRDMNVFGNQHWLPKRNDNRCFDLSSPAGLNDYLGEANTLGALFSYIPSVIVARKAWLSVKGNQGLLGTNYAHVHRLFSLLRLGSMMKYIDSPLVLCRMDNDSFSDKGLVHRYEIDFEGYLRISGELFVDDEPAKGKFLKVVRDEHRWYRLLVLRSHMQSQEEWDAHNQLLRSFGYSPLVLAFCGFMGRFKGLVALAVRTRKAIVRSLKFAV